MAYAGAIKGGGRVESGGRRRDRSRLAPVLPEPAGRAGAGAARTGPSTPTSGCGREPFRLGADRHAVKRERYGDKAGSRHARITWDPALRPRLEPRHRPRRRPLRAQLEGQLLGPIHHDAAARGPAAGSWQLGRYTGTTSQGLPVALTATWQRIRGLGLLGFTVRDLTASATFAGSQGPVTASVAPDPQERLQRGAPDDRAGPERRHAASHPLAGGRRRSVRPPRGNARGGRPRAARWISAANARGGGSVEPVSGAFRASRAP